ncbi:hypothetical protein [Corynebacterium renale]|nr:hypothetical protein [Corynebacterium renale]
MKKQRAERKRAGVKPPDKPVIWPVAQRPPARQEALMAALVKGLEDRSARPVKKKRISIAQLRQMRGQTNDS